MKITSPQFTNNQMLPKECSCDGAGVEPILHFHEIPGGAKTLALIMDDPDATHGTFVHWLIWNLPVTTASIGENTLPAESVIGKNGLKQNNYVPVCPPSGTHHYFFKLYALDVALDLPTTANKDDLLRMMTNHIVDQAELVGLYRRSILLL